MSAGVLNYTIQQMLQNGFADHNDPGASGTLEIENKGVAKFEVTTAGAESRALEAATRHPVGALCIVLAKTLVGNLTVTGAESSVVMTAEGDVAVFMVTNNDGTKVWRLVMRNMGNVDLSAAPVEVTGANDGSTGANAALTSLLTALEALGFITDSTT